MNDVSLLQFLNSFGRTGHPRRLQQRHSARQERRRRKISPGPTGDPLQQVPQRIARTVERPAADRMDVLVYCRQRGRSGPDCESPCSCYGHAEGLLNDTSGLIADLSLLCPDLLQLLVHSMLINGDMRDVINLLATCKNLWIQKVDTDIWEHSMRHIGMSGNFQRILGSGGDIASSILSLLDRKSYYFLMVPGDSTVPVPWHPDAIPIHISAGESLT